MKGDVALQTRPAADVKLDRDDIEEIVAGVVAALAEALPERAPGPPVRFVDAAVVAAQLGVDRDWVYAHEDELGAVRLGGSRGRLRFDLATLDERLAHLGSAPTRPASRPRGGGGQPQRRPSAPLIPYAGSQRPTVRG